MARHSSVSRTERSAAHAKTKIQNELRKLPAVKSDRFTTFERMLTGSQHHFELVAKLQAENSTTSRRKLREMREVRYDTDPAPTADGAWDDQAAKGKKSKRPVIGRDGKHQRIMKGQTARNNQAKGL